MKNIRFERGDSVKFGEQFCKEHNCEHLIGKTVLMTPHWFEYDDDYGGGYEECPGMIVAEGEEPQSIYHIFGNDFENFMDCVHIAGTDEDKENYKKIIDAIHRQEAESWESFASSTQYNGGESDVCI